MTGKDMMTMAMDTVDLQARESLGDMITVASQSKLRSEHFEKGLAILKEWDFRFDRSSVGASVYYVWEVMIDSYLHETAVKGLNARRTFAYANQGEHFFNR